MKRYTWPFIRAVLAEAETTNCAAAGRANNVPADTVKHWRMRYTNRGGFPLRKHIDAFLAENGPASCKAIAAAVNRDPKSMNTNLCGYVANGTLVAIPQGNRRTLYDLPIRKGEARAA